MSRPDGLEEESYTHALFFFMYWNGYRIVKRKRLRMKTLPLVAYVNPDKIVPSKSSVEEYSQNVLVTLKSPGSFSINEIKMRAEMDTDDLSLFRFFNSYEEDWEIESERDAGEEDIHIYYRELEYRWEKRVQEKKENKKIRERNEKRWLEYFELERVMEKHRPRGFFWPFG